MSKAEETADTQLVKLRQILLHADLGALAMRLRPGHELRHFIFLNLDDQSLHGEKNAHLPVNFTDGVRWLVRARQLGLQTPHLSERVMYAEIDTLRWLEQIGVPAPRVKSGVICELAFSDPVKQVADTGSPRRSPILPFDSTPREAVPTPPSRGNESRNDQSHSGRLCQNAHTHLESSLRQAWQATARSR